MRNESTLLPYWIRHYSTFADQITIYDDESDDGSYDMAVKLGATVQPCPWAGLDDIKMTAFAADQSRSARGKADWIVWVDADEFLYFPYILDHLSYLQRAGITVPKIAGYSMFSTQPPKGTAQIYAELRMGIPDPTYAKACIFNPQVDINWSIGKHILQSNDPKIRTNSLDPLKLFHYRYLGAEWHLSRNQMNYTRLTRENRQRLHGVETYPGYIGHHSPNWYASQIPYTYDVVAE